MKGLNAGGYGRYVPFALAIALALPGIAARVAGLPLSPPTAALLSGVAILGASFLLVWACDAAQADMSQALALALVALIAVLPEYAVDMYFTWQAGRHPDGQYAHYAIANMTGANRLLIGVAWGAIAAVCYLRHRQSVRVTKDRRTELVFLLLATAYAFLIPLKGSLAWYDGLVFLALYAWYIVLAGKRPATAGEPEPGPAETLLGLPNRQRRAITAGLFLFAFLAILTNAQPFCEGLVQTGKLWHINEFLLVQWLAPLASEAPEFVVALVFAWRGNGTMAIGSLLSSKLNQWTLLVGMIPGVYALAHGSFAQPLPMDGFQLQEVLLTAAQSLLAVVLLSRLRLTLSAAFLLTALFFGQLLAPQYLTDWLGRALGLKYESIHPFFSILYVVAAAALFLQHPRRLLQLRKGFATQPAPPLLASRSLILSLRLPDPPPPLDLRSPQCSQCWWRTKLAQALEAHRGPAG